MQKADRHFASFSLFCFLAAAVLHYEGLAVGTLILCRIFFVSSDVDFVERAIVYTRAMMLAGCDTALNAFVCVFVHL